jgi:hypothetical protein
VGNFKIEIEGIGGHGCQREVKDGGEVYGCQRMDCPDCLARALVSALRSKTYTVLAARFVHWPGEACEVMDDLLTGVRKGSF